MAMIWYSTDYYVNIDVLKKIHFCIKFDNLLFRSFYTFGCKQTVSKMFTDASAFATVGDAHSEHPVMVAIDGSTVHGITFYQLFYMKSTFTHIIMYVS